MIGVGRVTSSEQPTSTTVIRHKRHKPVIATEPPHAQAMFVAESSEVGYQFIILRRGHYPATPLFRWDATLWTVIYANNLKQPWLEDAGFGVTERGALRALARHVGIKKPRAPLTPRRVFNSWLWMFCLLASLVLNLLPLHLPLPVRLFVAGVLGLNIVYLAVLAIKWIWRHLWQEQDPYQQ